MSIWMIVGIVVAALVVLAIILEVVSSRSAKKDQEEFDKLSPEEKWKLQQEARKDHLLR